MNQPYAVVNTNTNKVENVVLWDSLSPWNAGPGYIIVPMGSNTPCGIGWDYDQANGTFSNPNLPTDLVEAKQAKVDEINKKTDFLIADGFTYNGIKFGCTEYDQLNYSGAWGMRDFITYPLKTKGAEAGVYYNIVNKTDHAGFMGAGMTYIQTCLNTGWSYKDMVNAMTDVDDVNNFVDPR